MGALHCLGERHKYRQSRHYLTLIAKWELTKHPYNESVTAYLIC